MKDLTVVTLQKSKRKLWIETKGAGVDGNGRPDRVVGAESDKKSIEGMCR